MSLSCLCPKLPCLLHRGEHVPIPNRKGSDRPACICETCYSDIFCFSIMQFATKKTAHRQFCDFRNAATQWSGWSACHLQTDSVVMCNSGFFRQRGLSQPTRLILVTATAIRVLTSVIQTLISGSHQESKIGEKVPHNANPKGLDSCYFCRNDRLR